MEKRLNVPLLQRLADKNGIFTRKQLILAQYVERNYQNLAYTTLTELAKKANVSETTVVRFVSCLDYRGFPEFMAALRKAVEQTAVADTDMRSFSTFDIEHSQYTFPHDICKAIFNLEMQVMQDTLSKIDVKKHQEAVEMIYTAPQVFSVASLFNACCSQFMGFVLQVLRPNVHIIEHFDIETYSLINSAPPQSTAIVFTTPRYAILTQKIAEAMRAAKFNIIGVSDSRLSPIVPLCDIFFQVPEKYVTFIDTNAAYMALIHSFAYALHFRDKEKARRNIAEYDSYAKKQKLYMKNDMDLVEVDYSKLINKQ